MAPNTSGWWTDEKVDATVTSQYVHSRLRPSEAEQLTKSVFGDLSDDTYLEWILTRSKRFFLTLVEAGVPDQIFGIIDDSWDDEDLPIPEDEVPGLLLSAEPDRTLDRRFYKAQFKYLIRVVQDGEHIRYAQEETVPVNAFGSKPVIGKAKDGVDKVKLPSDGRRVFVRKRLSLRNRGMEEELLAEMADWRSFAHDHVLSIFGSYTMEDSLYVLMTPAPEYSLKSFLNDSPKAFEAFSKTERRKIVLQWTHCLSSGLSWLHRNGKHHGAIRPSRIQIDDQFRISFGQFDGSGILCDSTVKDDIEAYQYAAPERWKRSVTIQATGRSVLPSGGRTGRRLTMEAERSLSGDSRHDHGSSTISTQLSTTRPTSVSYAFSPTSKTGTRLRLGSTKNAIARMGSTMRKSESRLTNHATDGLRPVRTSLEAHARPGATSVMSSNSSDGTKARRQGGPIYAATPEMRTAVVQTWASAQHDQLAADIFSLGSILMDILTFLCKHSYNSFARHRSTKNKSAGRGGGLADASFHANIGQVFSWAEMLHKDADKRIKKDDGPIFKAVGPCLQVILQCLDRDPSERLNATDLEKKLCDHIRDFAGLNIPQCCLNEEIDRSPERPQSRARDASTDGLHQGPHSKQHTSRGDRRPSNRAAGQAQEPEKTIVAAFSPRIDSLRISPSNLNTFNFEVDHAEDTLVGSEGKPMIDPQARPDSFAFATGDGIEVFPRPPTASSKVRQPRSEAGDQNTIASPVSSVPRYFHAAHGSASAAASTVGGAEDFHSVYSYTPPPTAHPTRELPPVPRSSNTKLSPTSDPTIHRIATQNPPRTTSRNVQILPAKETEPTALPALPSIDKVNITSLHDSTKSHYHNGRSPSRMDDMDEITQVEPNNTNNQRHYRAPSRTGIHEGRMYVSHLGREKMGLRGLQYP